MSKDLDQGLDDKKTEMKNEGNTKNERLVNIVKTDKKTPNYLHGERILFVVGATTMVNYSKPLSYTPTRSVYTHQERYEQLLYTIESIKSRLPQAFVLVAENSEKLPEEYHKGIEKAADHLLRCYDTVRTDSQHKGMGEAGCLLSGIRAAMKLKIEFDYFFKISGRYYLTDEFDVKRYLVDSKHVAFFQPPNENGVSTVLYCIPREMMPMFQTWLQKVGGETSMENYMYEFSKPYAIYVKPQGAAGRIAVDGFLLIR